MSGEITLLMNSGIDAFTNLYDIQITFPSLVAPQLYSTSTYGYSVRAMGFQPPELSLMTYNSDYKAVQLTKQAPKIQGERTFTIEFRQDTAYTLYGDLMNWKHIWNDPSGEGNVQPGSLSDNDTNAVTSDSDHYGSIVVVAYNVSTPLDGYTDPSSNLDISTIAAQWQFYDVICNKVGTPNFQRAGADAVTTTAEFIFGRMVEPWSSIGYGSLTGPPILTGETGSAPSGQFA
jgi:hypothetical protein